MNSSMLNLVRLIEIKLQYMLIAFIYYLCEITMISGTVLYCKSEIVKIDPALRSTITYKLSNL